MLFCFDFFQLESSTLTQRELTSLSLLPDFCFRFICCAEPPPQGMAKYTMTMRHSTAESTASTPEALNGFCTENEPLASTIKLADKFLSVRTMEATVFHGDQYILFTVMSPALSALLPSRY